MPWGVSVAVSAPLLIAWNACRSSTGMLAMGSTRTACYPCQMRVTLQIHRSSRKIRNAPKTRYTDRDHGALCHWLSPGTGLVSLIVIAWSHGKMADVCIAAQDVGNRGHVRQGYLLGYRPIGSPLRRQGCHVWQGLAGTMAHLGPASVSGANEWAGLTDERCDTGCSLPQTMMIASGSAPVMDRAPA